MAQSPDCIFSVLLPELILYEILPFTGQLRLVRVLLGLTCRLGYTLMGRTEKDTRHADAFELVDYAILGGQEWRNVAFWMLSSRLFPVSALTTFNAILAMDDVDLFGEFSLRWETIPEILEKRRRAVIRRTPNPNFTLTPPKPTQPCWLDPPLGVAAFYGHTRVLDHLHYRVDVKTFRRLIVEDGDPSLRQCARSGNTQVLDWLFHRAFLRNIFVDQTAAYTFCYDVGKYDRISMLDKYCTLQGVRRLRPWELSGLLCGAANGGHLEVMKYALGQITPSTPIHGTLLAAIKGGHVNAFRLCVELRLHLEYASISNFEAQAYIGPALKHGHAEIIDYVEWHITRRPYGGRHLIVAIESGYHTGAKHLVEKKGLSVLCMVDGICHFKLSVFHREIHSAEFVHWLLECGARYTTSFVSGVLCEAQLQRALSLPPMASNPHWILAEAMMARYRTQLNNDGSSHSIIYDTKRIPPEYGWAWILRHDLSELPWYRVGDDYLAEMHPGCRAMFHKKFPDSWRL